MKRHSALRHAQDMLGLTAAIPGGIVKAEGLGDGFAHVQ